MNIYSIREIKVKHNRVINLNTAFIVKILELLVLLLKTEFFLAILESSDANTLTWNNISFHFSAVHLAFILLLFSLGYLFSNNKRIKFYILLDIIYSVLLVLDLWYFRVNKDFYGFKNIFFSGTFNPLKGQLFNPKKIDIVFLVDIVIFIFLIIRRKINSNEESNFGKFLSMFSFAAVFILVSYVLVDIIGTSSWDNKMFKFGWTPLMSVRAAGPLGYHGFEACNSIAKVLHKPNNKDTEQVKEWLSQNREEIKDNQYKGMLKGKNVIFLQLESFENFVINREVNGKELTPFLNKLSNEGLYFDNIYEQNNAGNSIDCDLMVNTSILPLGEAITALNYGNVTYNNSLPRILKGEGYITVATHGEEPAEFNWTELHKNGFGTDILWDIRQYNYGETVGYGISDESFLTQLADKIKTLPQPFYINAPTLSSHGPFKIQSKYRELNLPKEIDESYLGGYFESVHYTDKQIEMFINKLNEEGILDNTVIFIYGDHAGVHKYYNEDIQKLSYDGDWWKNYDHKIPLIIYSKGISPKVVEAPGGQIDIMPTAAYLLGIDDSKYRNSVMGRILVNTNRDSTVIKGNIMEGQVKSDAEMEHLIESYKIAGEIIKNDYFGTGERSFYPVMKMK